MSIPDIVILALLGIWFCSVVFFGVRKLVRYKKSGGKESPCSLCSCASCAMHGQCKNEK